MEKDGIMLLTSKKINYYIGGTITQLPHILPIALKLGGTIYTNNEETKKWLRLNRPEVSCIRVKKVEEIAPCNIVVADYFKFPKSFNRIQIFHGFSLKKYINQCPWNYYDVIINPSPFYSLPIQHATGFSRSHLYSQTKNTNQTSTCLYCPTWNLRSTEGFESLKDQYSKIIVKFHPLDYNPHHGRPKNPIISKIESLGGEIIDPMSREYIEYDLLFNKANVMASDTSSIAYEFTLTGKPVLEHVNPNKEWYYNNNFFTEIERFLK